jgi:serine/threonine-protein kinase
MPVGPGVRFGPYDVAALIGMGGMGEVYRARDTRLGRDVALKVLPESVAQDADRLARFDREARALASLNHPNIAIVHGFEEVDGLRALVMELVEGPTLADVIARGRMPLDAALPIARQIAEALEAAHEHGIVHRDLKPANVKVRPDGTVKVLDFGLAKALEPAAAEPRDLAASPTISAQAETLHGAILGTPAYMSPEQVRGAPVDRRSDIWAFGCVLYELLTGRRAFEAENAADTLARVLTNEPSWNELPEDTPPLLRRMLRRCLSKERRQRPSDGAAVRIEIEDLLAGHAADEGAASAARPVPAWRRALAPSLALLAGVVIGGVYAWQSVRPPAPRVSRWTIAPPASAPLTIEGSTRDLAISPDGTRIVYTSGADLYVRAVDAIDATALGKGAWGRPQHPVFSPDGRWIVFFDGISVKKIAATGGPADEIASTLRVPQGVSWGDGDTIVFATADPRIGLQQVGANGGEPVMLTTPDAKAGEVDHVWPSILPGGRAVLFTITTTGGIEQSQVAVLDLSTGARKVLVRGGSDAQYVSPGYLVYAAAGALRAVRFDVQRLEITGTDVLAVDGVRMSLQAVVNASVAADGTLVYVPGAAEGPGRSLVWVNRAGVEEAVGAPPRAYVYPRLSPDGTRLAVYSFDEQQDLWLWDLGRRRLTRATFDSDSDIYPVWMPDGRRLVWASGRTGPFNVFMQSADGTGAIDRVADSARNQIPSAVTADGTAVVLREEERPGTGTDLMILTLADRQVKPLLATPAAEFNGEVSPDGRWLAYESDQTGRFEIYVRPFPDTQAGGPWQVSTGGGRQALWARNGRELFYRTPDGAVMAVPVDGGRVFRTGPPAMLIAGPYLGGTGSHVGRTYDVTRDGSRFLMVKDDGGGVPPVIHVVLNWSEELKRLLPLDGRQ